MTYGTTNGTIKASANISPIFIRTPVIATVKLQGQIANRDTGTATPELLYAAGSAGGFIETIEIYPLGANVKTVLRLYYTLPYLAGYQLFREVTLPAVAAAPTDDVITGYPIKVSLPKVLFPASPNPAVPNEGLRVPSGCEIRCALGVAIASGVIVTATGGDY